MRILVAEDEKDFNRLICKTLERAGYSVDACFDGEVRSIIRQAQNTIAFCWIL